MADKARPSNQSQITHYDLTQLKKAIGELEISCMDVRQRHFRSLAGALADGIQKNPEEARNLLYSSDPRVRRAAILVIGDHCGASESFLDYCLRTLSRESDADVRMTIVSVLARLYSDTSDTDVCRALADIVISEIQPAKTRALAYLALFRVVGRGVDERIRLKILKNQCIPGEELDWAFVKSFAGR
jgi:hypothetical protein